MSTKSLPASEAEGAHGGAQNFLFESVRKSLGEAFRSLEHANLVLSGIVLRKRKRSSNNILQFTSMKLR